VVEAGLEPGIRLAARPAAGPSLAAAPEAAR
jgi:hypothetical protein